MHILLTCLESSKTLSTKLKGRILGARQSTSRPLSQAVRSQPPGKQIRGKKHLSLWSNLFMECTTQRKIPPNHQNSLGTYDGYKDMQTKLIWEHLLLFFNVTNCNWARNAHSSNLSRVVWYYLKYWKRKQGGLHLSFHKQLETVLQGNKNLKFLKQPVHRVHDSSGFPLRRQIRHSGITLAPMPS